MTILVAHWTGKRMILAQTLKLVLVQNSRKKEQEIEMAH